MEVFSCIHTMLSLETGAGTGAGAGAGMEAGVIPYQDNSPPWYDIRE